MKKLLLALLVSPALVHARYEDITGEPPTLSEVNLPVYLGAALVGWLYLAWGGGWRARWLPLSLAALAVGAAWGWGMDGVGLVAMLAFPVGLWALTRLR